MITGRPGNGAAGSDVTSRDSHAAFRYVFKTPAHNPGVKLGSLDARPRWRSLNAQFPISAGGRNDFLLLP